MELNQYATILLRRWWLIVLATVLAAGASVGYSYRSPVLYRTTTTLLVGQFMSSENPQAGDFTISQMLAQYYAQVAHRQSVLQATHDALGLSEPWYNLMGEVNALAPANSNTIQITAADRDPALAQKIADEVAHQVILQSPTPSDADQQQQRQFLQQQLTALQDNINKAQKQVDDLNNQITNETSALAIQDLQARIDTLNTKITGWRNSYTGMLGWYQGSRTNFLSVVQPAFLPVAPVSPSEGLNLMLAASIGFVLAVGAAFVLEYLDDRLRTREDVRRVLALPVLGVVGGMGKLGKKPTEGLVVVREPSSPEAEAYRDLRTNVELAAAAERRAIMVTSPGGREGRSVTAVNLAASLARGGRRTILVDADLRQPSIHTLLELSNATGLTTLLQSPQPQPVSREAQPRGAGGQQGSDDDLLKHRLEAFLRPVGLANLRVLPSGPVVDGPGDLLAAGAMDRVLKALWDLADAVVVDTPPALQVADAGTLAAKGMGTLLVVDVTKTRGKMADMAKQILSGRGTILGVVLNRAPRGATVFGLHRPQAAKRKESSPAVANGADVPLTEAASASSSRLN